ncbi:MAG: serine/threonine-protein kinase, partial [bacterium]|nr:serine/threonine-protein kinase [bacterium]
MIGQIISHYKIVEKLGEGSTGSVYLAEDEKGGESVVLKMLPANLATASLNTKGFLQDAGSARALNHPNVGSVYGIEDSPEGAFVVREFVSGKALSENKGPLPVETVLTIAREIAAGLTAAHEKGMVHRDIESETIILTDAGHVKIMDFGVGRLSDDSHSTDPSARIGSPAYLSPEQVEDGEAGKASDLWSLGVVLYELLTGELPFKGEPEAALLYEILNAPPGEISRFRSDVPGHLEKLVSRLLEKDPACRPG